ncbi:hypothetical protein ACFRMQ_06080 [Kitasatospora sp. NPDC056783]|uniref:hypothetical protein n=1 Tax=Kitasatospora sp. NPDC056783 TaxID=3345943 RepID=UPI00368B7F46
MSRQVIGPADMNSQVYDVHNALYTVANDHEASINQLKANPVLSVTLQNPLSLPANASSVAYWNTSNPLARVGTWATTDGGTIKVPEAGVYRFTMSSGGWSVTGLSKVRAWIITPTARGGGFYYPPLNEPATNSFTLTARMNAGESFTAWVVSWWNGFRSDNGLGDDRDSWNLTVEKISA